MASTSTSPQIPSTSTPTSWDVFLSFRGTDTRNGFTSYLYEALKRNGITTFMDDPGLSSGDLISDSLLGAIKDSKTYIVVLSENFASSRWCLDELVEILRCSKEPRKLVIPVFYRIEPSVVRHQTGTFEAAFQKHKTRFAGEIEKVKHWSDALQEVAEFSGKHVVETRAEVDIINEVVDAILSEINPRTLHVAKYPIGINFHLVKLTKLLIGDTRGVHYVGIWGMGGVGKTTLAKALYNANCGSFDASCFLANVAEVCEKNGLQDMQAQLIADLFKVKKPSVASVHHGTELIGQRIRSKKVLVVVDDLNDQKQLDSLLLGSAASGSVIILTTRHRDLLVRVGVESPYQYMLNELSDADSRQLFNKHAFGDENPSNEFVVLSQEIVHHARGLPLALEIFGSNLRNQPETQWRRFIGGLNEVVHPDIMNKLLVSFKSLLTPTLKEMFLDIACLFVGRFRTYVVPILGSCYKDVDANIDHLESRCLIKINFHDRFMVHDLVQDMAWEIARQSSAKDELSKHSRLSGWKDICNALDDNNDSQVTAEIQCIVQPYDHHVDYFPGRINEAFDTKAFKRMPKLRFLKMEGVNLRGSFEHIFKDLTWLNWARCPLKILPSDFCPKKLVILELPDSEITMWKLSKDLINLKILDLSFSRELITTPDFCRLPCLEEIYLSYCEKLKKVDTTIGNLKNLVSLDLEGCESLSYLPDSICKLTALLSLNVGYMKKLKTLGDTICNLRSLENLDLEGCEKLEELVPYSSNQMSSLQLPNLRYLNLSYCGSMKRLPNLYCKQLKLLLLTDCSSLIELEGVEELSSIEHFDLTSCISMRRLPNLSHCKQLKFLYLTDCSSLIELEGVEELSSIEEFDLTGCISMRRLSPAAKKWYRISNLEYWSSLIEIEGLEEFAYIKELSLEGCSSMKRFPNLSNLKGLYRRNLKDCNSLRDIEGLEKIASIKGLYLRGCSSIERLPNLSNFKQLHTLNLRNCNSLRDIEGLEELTSIRELDLIGCDSTILTLSLLQRYSEFGNFIEIHVDEGGSPRWMRDSSWGTKYLSDNLSGLLFSLTCVCPDSHIYGHVMYGYRIGSGTIDQTRLMESYCTLMVIVPFTESSWSSDGEAYRYIPVSAYCVQHPREVMNMRFHPLYRSTTETHIPASLSLCLELRL